jgi:hypothetical protein
MTADEISTFFEDGKVELELFDLKSRQVLVSVQIPNCLFQAVTPSLLGAGFVDDLRISDPICVWIPQISKERISLLGSQVADIENKINIAIKSQVEILLNIFSQTSSLLANPSDLVPMLPLGTYVCFKYRCNIDRIPDLLSGIQNTPVNGVHEFQWAMASILNAVLSENPI